MNPDEWISGRARRIADQMLQRQRAGEQLTEYSERWEDLEGEFRAAFPGEAPDRARDRYHILRNQFSSAGVLQQNMQGGVQTGRYLTARTPLFGPTSEGFNHSMAREAADRIQQGQATQEDYQALGSYLGHQQGLGPGNRSAGLAALDVASAIPGFAAEFALTAPAFGAGSAAVRQGLGGVAGGAIRQNVVSGLGYVGGAAAQTAANVPRVAGATAERMAPNVAVQQDQEGRAAGIEFGPARDFWEALPGGTFDAFVETFTEALGGSRPFQAVSNAVGAVAGGSTNALIRKVGLERVTAAIQQGITRRLGPSAGNMLQGVGWNGAIGELLEERAGEVMRGAAGEGYGSLGMANEGDIGGFLRQMAIEGLAFGIFGAGNRAVGALNTRLRGDRRGAENRQAAVSLVGDPARPATMHQPGTPEYTLAQQTVAAQLRLAQENIDNPEEYAAEVSRLQPWIDHYQVDPENVQATPESAPESEAPPETSAQPETEAGIPPAAGQTTVEDYVREQIAKQGYVGIRNPYDAVAFSEQHPDYIKEIVDGEARFRPPAAPQTVPTAPGGQVSTQTSPAAAEGQPALPPAPASLDPKVVAFIQKKVADLGSMEAVEKLYSKKSAVGAYARAVAKAMFQPAVQQVTKPQETSPPAPAPTAKDRILEDMRRRRQGLAPIAPPSANVQPPRVKPRIQMDDLSAIDQLADPQADARSLLERAGRQASRLRGRRVEAEEPPGAEAPAAAEEPGDWRERVLQNRIRSAKEAMAAAEADPSKENKERVAAAVEGLRRIARARGMNEAGLLSRVAPSLAEQREKETAREEKRLESQQKPHRLRSIVKEKGGIDAKKFGTDWNAREDFFEAGMGYILSKKGGSSLDDMAQSLQIEGHLRVPEGVNADDFLMERLKADALSDLYDAEEELRRAQEEHYREVADAKRRGRNPETSRAVGEESGLLEEQGGAAQEADQGVADAEGAVGEAGERDAGDADESAPAPDGSVVGQVRALIARAFDENANFEQIEAELEALVGGLSAQDAIQAARDLGYNRSSKKQALAAIRKKVFEAKTAREEVAFYAPPGGAAKSPGLVNAPAPGTAQSTAQGEPIGSMDLVEALSKLFNVPYQIGRLRHKALAVYHVKPELIRTKGNTFALHVVMAHEVAHHLDKAEDITKGLPGHLKQELGEIDYDQEKKRPFEGFAEYMRMRLTDPAQAQQAAPAFHKWFNNWLGQNNEWAQKIGRAEQLYRRYQDQGAAAQVKGQVEPVGSRQEPQRDFLQRLGGMLNNLRYQFVDQFRYLEAAQEEATGRLKPGEAPVTFLDKARALQKMGPAMAADAIMNGPRKMTGKMERVGPGLQEVFKDVPAARHDDFVAFLYARHALEAHEKGINPGISQEAAQQTFDELKSAEWEAAADKFTAFNNGLQVMLEDAGYTKPGTAAKLAEAWKTYIPLARVKQDGSARSVAGSQKYLDLPSPVKRRVGSDLKIVDPVEETVARAMRFYADAAKHIVVRDFADAMERVEGMGKFAFPVPPALLKTQFRAQEIKEQLEKAGIDPDALEDMDPTTLMQVFRPDYWAAREPNSAIIYRNGQPVLYRFQPEIFKSLSGLEPAHLPPALATVFGWATTVQKLGATGLNPDFALRNLARDFMTYFFQQKGSSMGRSLVNPFTATAAYVGAKINAMATGKKDPVVELWERAGGPLGTWLGSDVKKGVAAAHRQVTGKSQGYWSGGVYYFAKAVDGVRGALSFSEAGPRLAEFQAILDKHGWTKERLQTEEPPVEVLVEAINAANDVTVNFSRAGAVGKQLNIIFPFFNATIQGGDKFIRTVRDDWKNNKPKFFLKMGLLIGGTFLYWLRKKDEDWYKQAKDWQKYGYFTITDDKGKPLIGIPRPFEWGWIVSAGAEAIFNAIDQRRPGELLRYAQTAGPNLIPAAKPSLITPLLEGYFNWDLFRNDYIVHPHEMDNRRPADQARPWTSGFMRLIGETFNISPARLEHVVNQLTGGSYDRTARAARTLRGQATDPSDIPGVGGFFFRQDYARAVDEMYAAHEQARQALGSANSRGTATPQLRDAAWRLGIYREMMGELRDAGAGAQGRDARFAVDRYRVGLAMRALGQDPLARYPSPFSGEAPANVAAVRDEFAARMAEIAAAPRPAPRQGENQAHFQNRLAEWTQQTQRARALLSEWGVTPEQMRRVLLQRLRGRGMGAEAIQARLQRVR